MLYIKRILLKISRLRILGFIKSSTILKWQWKIRYGTKLNINNPQTFSEKLQYLKINQINKEYTKLVDKVEVRNVIEKKIGEEYLIPILWFGNNVNDIPYNDLPNSFVIKCNHGSHCNILVKDKEKIDIKSINKKLNKWLKTNWYYFSREYPYKGVNPQIIIEKYMGNINTDLVDYKFFCFNGDVEFCQIIQNRSKDETMNFYDTNWNKLDIYRVDDNKNIYPASNEEIIKPSLYDEMINIAKILSSGHKFVRIDLYLIENKVYFGEITFFPAAGFCEFSPQDINYKLGALIELNN